MHVVWGFVEVFTQLEVLASTSRVILELRNKTGDGTNLHTCSVKLLKISQPSDTLK